MIFPKHLVILLTPNNVRNVTQDGEVTNHFEMQDLHIVQLLSIALGFSYKLYSYDSRESGDLFVGNFILDEDFFPYGTYPIRTASYTFATEKPHFVVNTLAFLNPFALSVWATLFLTIVLVTSTLCLVYRGKIPFPYALFRVSSAFLAQHRDWKPKSLAQKLLVFAWSLGITIVTLSYGSMLLSFMSVPVRDRGITDFNELHEAIYHGKATALKFTFNTIDHKFIESGDKKFAFIGEHLRKQKLALGANEDGEYFQIIKPNVAIVDSRQMLELLFQGDTYFISEESVFMSYNVIYQWSGTFCCMKKLNEVIHWIWAAGLNKKITDDKKCYDNLSIYSKHGNKYKAGKEAILPLSLSNLSGAFYILIIGHFLGSLCLLCELYAARRSGQSKAIFK